MTKMKDIDGYVTKDSLYRLISRIKHNPDIAVDNTTCNIIIEAISDMPKEDVKPRVDEDDYSEDYCVSSPPFAWDMSEEGW